MTTGINRHKWEPYLWLLPSTLLVSVFVLFPILDPDRLQALLQ